MTDHAADTIRPMNEQRLVVKPYGLDRNRTSTHAMPCQATSVVNKLRRRGGLQHDIEMGTLMATSRACDMI